MEKWLYGIVVIALHTNKEYIAYDVNDVPNVMKDHSNFC